MKQKPTVGQKIYNILLKIVSPEFYVVYYAFVLPGVCLSLLVVGALLGNIYAPFVVIGECIVLGIGLLWMLLAGFMFAPILTGFIVVFLLYIVAVLF